MHIIFVRTAATSRRGTASGPGSLRLTYRPVTKSHHYKIVCTTAYNCVVIRAATTSRRATSSGPGSSSSRPSSPPRTPPPPPSRSRAARPPPAAASTPPTAQAAPRDVDRCLRDMNRRLGLPAWRERERDAAAYGAGSPARCGSLFARHASLFMHVCRRVYTQ